MGACDFRVHVVGTDLNKAFKEAVDQALYDYGHRGYTGTIAEKDAVVLRKREAFANEKEADAFINEDIENNDKWGDAYAVRVPDGFIFYGFASS